MRKLILHLAIACFTFGVSVLLTNIWTSLKGTDLTVPILQRPAVASVAVTTDPGLAEIYRDYASAQTNHDRAFFERVEADDFVLFMSGSKPLSRAEDIQLLNNSAKNIIYQSDDVTMETYGNTAVVTGRMIANDGDGISYSWRWIDVCVKRDGHWQIQSTTQAD
jgi:hypothetical protein